MMDDGGTDVPLAGGVWRQSMARITGMPPRIRISHVGDRDKQPPPATFGQIQQQPQALAVGPLGPVLLRADWSKPTTSSTRPRRSTGTGARTACSRVCTGIAYSLDRGEHWQFANKPFPAPLGNLNWVIRGRGGVFPDGYVYAIATEREFNANKLIIGRARPTSPT